MALNVLAPEWVPSRKRHFTLSPSAKPWIQRSSLHTDAVPLPQHTQSPIMVDTLAGIQSMLQTLSRVQLLAVDCEGVDLSRNGKLCILIVAAQTASASARVWLVDVHTLGTEAFTTAVEGPYGNLVSLKSLLESPAVRKLMWDPRQDSNALWHQYGVYLTNVLCLQIAEVAHRLYVKGQSGVTHVLGLGKCFEVYLPRHRTSDSQIDKRSMRKRFNEDPQLWTRRPLSDTLVRYCCQDVSHLFLLRALLTAGLSPDVTNKVEALSLERVNECHQAKETEQSLRAFAPKL